MKSNFVNGAVLALGLVHGWAGAESSVLKVNEKLHRVGVEAGSLKAGDLVEVAEFDRRCTIKILKINGEMAVGSTACKDLQQLVGKRVRPVSEDRTISSESESSEGPGSVSKVGLGIAPYFSTANQLKLHGTATATPLPSMPFDGTASTDMGFGLSVFYLKILSARLGPLVSLDYELPRKMNTFTGTVGNTSFSGTSQSKIGLLDAVANLAYAINEGSIVYLGFNWPVQIMVSNANGSEYKGTLGYQGGFLYRFNDLLLAAVEYRLVRGKQESSAGGGSTSLDLKFDGFNLRFGVSF